MKFFNYATQIDTFKLVQDIEYTLMLHQALSIQKEYRSGRIVGLSFNVDNGNVLFAIRLPVKVEQCYKMLRREKDVNPRRDIIVSMEQAEKVAWSIMKDWVEAQMVLLDMGIAKLEEIFMPYIIDRTGETIWEKMERQQICLIGRYTWEK